MMFLSAANEDVVPADIAVLGLCRWGESPGGTRLRVLDDVGAWELRAHTVPLALNIGQYRGH
jgi:hypothetical protein